MLLSLLYALWNQSSSLTILKVARSMFGIGFPSHVNLRVRSKKFLIKGSSFTRALKARRSPTPTRYPIALGSHSKGIRNRIYTFLCV